MKESFPQPGDHSDNADSVASVWEYLQLIHQRKRSKTWDLESCFDWYPFYFGLGPGAGLGDAGFGRGVRGWEVGLLDKYYCSNVPQMGRILLKSGVAE